MAFLQAYSVLDIKTVAFLAPYFMRTNGEAIRAFSDACNSGDHQFNRHPADYVLFHVGGFDEGTGEIVPCSHDNLGKALDFLEKPTAELFAKPGD